MRSWQVRDEPKAASYIASGAWRGSTIAGDARSLADRSGDDPIFLGEPEPITVASLLADAIALAASLHRLGIQPGEAISFMIPNWPEAAAINLAAALMGYVVNPIVPIYRDAETGYILRDCRSRAIFIPATFRRFDYPAMIARLLPDLPDLDHVIIVRGEGEDVLAYTDLLTAGRATPLDPPNVDPAGVKMVMYTSGTTGAPKGVLHSHNTLARAVAASSDYWGIGPGDVVLMPSPVTHVSGYSNGIERPFLGGTRTILMESWNAESAVDLIDHHGGTMTVAATPFLQELVDAARHKGSRLESFRVFACGGAPVPPDLIRRANAAFAHPCAFRVYGSSEAPFVSLGYVGEDAELAALSDGRILDYEVRIVDAEGYDADEGEILVRGPALFRGYSDPEQTRESFTPDGYFKTGDVGRRGIDDTLTITDRIKDIIIRGGENISAKEIEDALHRHGDVAEAAVVAAPHERLGEGIFAYLVVHSGAAPTPAALCAFLEQSGLARQKLPEGFAIVDLLPRTASGKVRKDQLRARLASVEAL